MMLHALSSLSSQLLKEVWPVFGVMFVKMHLADGSCCTHQASHLDK